MKLNRRELLGAGTAIGVGLAAKGLMADTPAPAAPHIVSEANVRSAASPENPQLAAKFKSGAFKGSDGSNMPYRYFEPAAKAGAKFPVILYLHGEDEAGTDNNAQLTTTDCATVWIEPKHLALNPTYVVAPQLAKGKNWSDDPAYSNTLALLDKFIKDHPSADTNRIYIVGFSMGATGLWKMLLKNPTIFSAAMPISGSAEQYLDDYEAWAGIKNTHVFIIHAYDDRIVPVAHAENALAALHAGGNRVFGPTPCLWGQNSTPSPHDAWYTAFRKFEVVYYSMFLGDFSRTKNRTIDPTTLYTHGSVGDGISYVWDLGLDTSWVIERQDKAVIVDTTEGNGNIYQYIRENVLVNKDVPIEIFLTHNHGDHIIGLASFANSPQLQKVYSHKADSVAILEKLGTDTGKFHAVKDGDMIPLGGDHVEVIHCPGHTLGSIVMKYKNYLFSGDSVGTGYDGVSVYPIELFIKSMEHLLDRMGTGKYTIYGGHTGECTGPMTEQYAKDLLACARAIFNNSLPGTPYWRAGEFSTRRVTTVGGSSITYPVNYIHKVKGALSDLVLSKGRLNPQFAGYTAYYAVTVDGSTESLTITPTALEADNKSITINGAAVASEESHTVALKAGDNRFSIASTAGDGTARTYTLNVRRGGRG